MTARIDPEADLYEVRSDDPSLHPAAVEAAYSEAGIPLPSGGLTEEEIEGEDWDNCDQWPHFQIWYEHHMGPYCILVQAPRLEVAPKGYSDDPYYLCCVPLGEEPCQVVVEEIMTWARPLFVSSDQWYADDQGTAFDLAKIGAHICQKFRLYPADAQTRDWCKVVPEWLAVRLCEYAGIYRPYLPGLEWVCPCGLRVTGPLQPARLARNVPNSVQISVMGTVYHWCHGPAKTPATMAAQEKGRE